MKFAVCGVNSSCWSGCKIPLFQEFEPENVRCDINLNGGLKLRRSKYEVSKPSQLHCLVASWCQRTWSFKYVWKLAFHYHVRSKVAPPICSTHLESGTYRWAVAVLSLFCRYNLTFLFSSVTSVFPTRLIFVYPSRTLTSHRSCRILNRVVIFLLFQFFLVLLGRQTLFPYLSL